MLVAIVSDIHGNLAALQAVLADAEKRHATELWCLGDVVGYGPDPLECIDAIRERARVCLSGNHDLAAVGKLSLDEFNTHAGAAVRWTMAQLRQEDTAFLGGLPPKLVHDGVTLAHASPREPVWEYVLSRPVAIESFKHFDTPMCWVGHSHIPFVCLELVPGGACDFYLFPEDQPLPIGSARMIVNPGSVGQPRDQDPKASYVVYDRAGGQLYHHRVAYDIAKTQERMRHAGLPAYLIERLSRGT